MTAAVARPPDTDPVAAAHAAGLRYVNDARLPGIRRRRAGASFAYRGPDGRAIRDAETLARIKRLAIPPAWTDVWICPTANGHVQATGRDARGRKQYRYHARWREVRDETKYGRMVAFGIALAKIRAKTEEHLALPGLPREKVLATVVRLLETTNIRVGNEEYARRNRSFGLTTLRERHVDVTGERIHFHFRGKSGKQRTVDVRDRRLAAVVRRCQSLPGQELFQYVDADGSLCTIESGDVNAYLREISGDDFTAKDFRTWAGTVLAATALRRVPLASTKTATKTEAKRHVVEAIAATAERLGNTPAVCRKCYVHPAVLDAFVEGTLARVRAGARARNRGLTRDEAIVLALLLRLQQAEAEAATCAA